MKVSILTTSILVLLSSFAYGSTAPLSSPATKLSTTEKERVRSSIRGRVLVAGTWTGGGGEGVICFPSKDIKASMFESDGRLKSGATSSKSTLQLWDLFENNFGDLPLIPRQGDTIKSYLDYVVSENIEYASPYFAFRVKQALALILNSDGTPNWEDRGSLHRLDDGGVRRKKINTDTCEIVQLVARYQRPGKNGIPEVFVDYDKNLFDHLGDEHPTIKLMNQAMLILHEALWLAGVEIGMPDSSSTRQLNYLLMSRGLKSILNQQGVHRRSLMFTTLVYSLKFKNLNALFMDSTSEAKPYTKESRQRARAELAIIYRENAQALVESGRIQPNCKPLQNKSCNNEILQSLVKRLTPEQAFLFLTASLNNTGKIRQDIDVFIIPGDDRQVAGEVCSYIKEDFNRTTTADDPWLEYYPLALRYCDALKLTP